MQVVNIRQLKDNPSKALKSAKDGLVMVTNRNEPEAILVSMEQLTAIPNMDKVRVAIGVKLFKDRILSLSASAKMAGISLSEMINTVSAAGIPVVDYPPEELEEEYANYLQWLGSKEKKAS